MKLNFFYMQCCLQWCKGIKHFATFPHVSVTMRCSQRLLTSIVRLHLLGHYLTLTVHNQTRSRFYRYGMSPCIHVNACFYTIQRFHQNKKSSSSSSLFHRFKYLSGNYLILLPFKDQTKWRQLTYLRCLTISLCIILQLLKQ